MCVYNPKFATLTFPLAKGRGSEPRGLSSTVFVLLLFLVLVNQSNDFHLIHQEIAFPSQAFKTVLRTISVDDTKQCDAHPSSHLFVSIHFSCHRQG